MMLNSRYKAGAALEGSRQRSSACVKRPAQHGKVVTHLNAVAGVTTTITETTQSYVSVEARKALFSRAQEIKGAEATIKGEIPSWLSGSIMVNGGAEYTGKQHMFDGYAMLCKLSIDGGRVVGSQQFIQSKAFKHYESTGKMLFREFATPAVGNSAGETAGVVMKTVALMATGQEFATDNPSVNVVPLPDGTVLAVSESRPSVYRMDPNTLETLGQYKYDDAVPGDLTTAHPKTLPDGTLVNFTRSLPFGGYHVYTQDPVTLKRTQVAFIRDRDPLRPCWVHDIAASTEHLVIVESPLFISMPSLMAGTPASHVFMNWRPEQGSRVHVVPLKAGGGPVRTFSAPAFFSFHTANAFEEGGQLHVDLSVYDDPTIVNDLNLDRLREYPGREVSRSWLRRLSIPLAGGSDTLAGPRPLMRDEDAHGHFTEFTSVSPLKRGIKHRYVWGNGAVRPTNMGNALAKYDVETGEVAVWHEGGSLPGEPAFVPSPSARSEDDGVLLSVVMSASGTSFLLVLDGTTMKELGRAELPYAVPYRFHGTFLPNRH